MIADFDWELICLQKKGYRLENQQQIENIFIACGQGDLEALKSLLIDHDVSKIQLSGFTLMHAAVTANKHELLDYLISNYNLSPVKPDQFGYTPLHIAAKFDKLISVRYLIEVCHADIECKTKSGYTPLLCSVTHASLETIRYLIETAGADVRALSATNKGISDYVVANPDKSVINYVTNLCKLLENE